MKETQQLCRMRPWNVHNSMTYWAHRDGIDRTFQRTAATRKDVWNKRIRSKHQLCSCWNMKQTNPSIYYRICSNLDLTGIAINRWRWRQKWEITVSSCSIMGISPNCKWLNMRSNHSIKQSKRWDLQCTSHFFCCLLILGLDQLGEVP